MTLRYFTGVMTAVAALAVLTLPTPSPAQAPAAPGVAAGGLVLTPAEQARYNARLQKFNAEVAALKADPKLSPAQKQAKFNVMKKALDDDMLAILTPEQKTQVLKLRAQQSTKVAAFQKAHQSEIAQGNALAAKLTKSLTPAERAQINKLTADTSAQINQVNADKTLSPQIKAAKDKALADGLTAKITAVLTPAQQADYKKMLDMQKKLIAEANTPTHP